MTHPYHIRRSHPQDIVIIGDIWLRGSLQAHDFISGDYWRGQLAAMCDIYFPSCELWILEANGDILGFIALHHDELSALFVDTHAQGKGWGVILLDHAKQLRGNLWLAVYEKNRHAQIFYERHGFTKHKRQVCENTDAYEWIMVGNYF